MRKKGKRDPFYGIRTTYRVQLIAIQLIAAQLIATQLIAVPNLSRPKLSRSNLSPSNYFINKGYTFNLNDINNNLMTCMQRVISVLFCKGMSALNSTTILPEI
jgi:hypothetical protein